MSVRCFLVEPIPGPGPKRWRRTDTGETFDSLAGLPQGAMWDALWMIAATDSQRERFRSGGYFLGGVNEQDGRWLVVRLPNGHDWCIDSRCNNCTRPNDNAHRCWIRHGEPPNITVDKNGVTCSAGGGSIQSGDFHGFLRNGVLE